jgi:hypothetical protein
MIKYYSQLTALLLIFMLTTVVFTDTIFGQTPHSDVAVLINLIDFLAHLLIVWFPF